MEAGAHDADLVCVLLDAREGIDEEAEAILTRLATVKHDKILVLNKIDLVPREKLLALAKAANDRLHFEKTFMISALSGDGVGDLRHALAAMVPPGPFHYHLKRPDVEDAPMRHAGGRDVTPGKRSSASCIRNCRINPPSRPTAGPSARTNRSASSRRSLSSAKASAKIVLGKGGATIKSIGAGRGKNSPRSWACPCIFFYSSKCARTGATIPTATVKWDSNSPRNNNAMTAVR